MLVNYYLRIRIIFIGKNKNEQLHTKNILMKIKIWSKLFMIIDAMTNDYKHSY